ncbi:hypothetical protein GOV08_02525 [Candidatus Woesearchaeota archaeon]|nr:hypothetical protein [Candidatus Woesearchaeota archaeon]
MKKKYFLILIIIFLLVVIYYAAPPPEGSGCINDAARANKFCSELSQEECGTTIIPQEYFHSLTGDNYTCRWSPSRNICKVGFACM